MTLIVPESIATTPLSSLLPFVLPQVPSCPDDVAEFNLLQAAIEFCQRTTVWRAWQGEITTLENTTRYEFVVDADACVTKLLMVLLDGEEVGVVAPGLGRQLDARESTSTYAYGELDTFEIRPQPKADLALQTFAALMPTQQATTIPANFQRYYDTIANGAKARLFKMKRSDWYDPTEADRLRGEFLDRCSTVARATTRGHAKTRRDPSARFY